MTTTTPSPDDGGQSQADIEEDRRRRTVRVPVARDADPFGGFEYAEVDADAAGEWDARCWERIG